MIARACIDKRTHGYFSLEWSTETVRLAYLNGSRERQARLQLGRCLICGGAAKLVDVTVAA